MAEPTPADPPEGIKKPIPRRDFVKKSMIAASAGAALAFGAPNVVPLSYNPRKIPRFPYLGARVLPRSPAPQGIPLIPVTINKDGVLEGVPENKLSPIKHNLDWYKYCSHEVAPGLTLDFTDDNKFYYYTNPEKVLVAKAQGLDPWYSGLLGQPLRPEHFKALGDGAPFRWRSEGQVGTNIVTGILIKVNPEKVKSLPAGFVHDNKDGTGFIAVCSFCAHFCCVPGYLENNSPLTKGQSSDKGEVGVNNTIIYCSCHDSRYDFMDVRKYTFPPDF
jgi:hypothetical protein